MIAGQLAALTASARSSGAPSYTGPLDIVSGAVVAYSQMRLAAAFSGNVVTITGGDGTTQSFAADTDNAVDQSAVAAFLAGAARNVVVSATIANGGSGYDNGVDPSAFDVTVVGGTGTAAVVSVQTNGSGVVDTVIGVTAAGLYSIDPTSPVATTGDDGVNHGTGLTLNLTLAAVPATVAKAFDQSGNSHDVLTLAGVPEPLWVANAVNSLPVFRGDGTRGLGTAGSVTLPDGAYTVFAVVAPQGLGSHQVCGINGQTASGNDYWSVQTGNHTPNGYLTVDAATDAFANEAGGSSNDGADMFIQFGVVAVAWQHGSKQYFYNGVSLGEQSSFDAGGALAAITNRFGFGVDDVLSPSHFFDGDMPELLVYSGILSGANIAAISQNQMTRYGL